MLLSIIDLKFAISNVVLVCLVYLVCLVCFVSFVSLVKTRLERPAGSAYLCMASIYQDSYPTWFASTFIVMTHTLFDRFGRELLLK